MHPQDRLEAVAAMLADELEEMVMDDEAQCHDGIPFEKRKELVEMICRRFEYFYDLGWKAAKGLDLGDPPTKPAEPPR